MQFKILLPLFLLLSTTLSGQLLFPGDLNNDGEANHIDLLSLAIAYGQGGPERPDATLEWLPQESFFWEIGLPVTGVDLTFVDADGNGLLDSLDLDAIALNYDSTQTIAIPPPQPYSLTDTFVVDELPRLSLSLNRTEAMAGDTLEISVFLNIPNPDVFPPSNPPTALACIISFDPDFINEEAIFYEPDSDAGDLMYIAANVNSVDFGRSPASGTIEYAFGGRGQGALAMSRPIGKFIIVIEDMILLEGDPGFTIEDQVMINLNEEVIELQVQGDELLVTDTENIIELADNTIYPNPTSGLCTWCTEYIDDQLKPKLYTTAGQRISAPITQQANCWQIDLTSLPAGLYWIEQQINGKQNRTAIMKK